MMEKMARKPEKMWLLKRSEDAQKVSQKRIKCHKRKWVFTECGKWKWWKTGINNQRHAMKSTGYTGSDNKLYVNLEIG
jgi:hypothetical protein